MGDEEKERRGNEHKGKMNESKEGEKMIKRREEEEEERGEI